MSLTTVAYKTRIGIKIGLAVFVLTIIANLAFDITGALYRYFLVPKETGLTFALGKIPPPNIPILEITGTPTYNLETTTGRLPAMPTIINVYSVMKPSYIFSMEGVAESIAASVGFKGAVPAMETANTYLWKDNQKNLRINRVTGNFTFESDLRLLESKVFPGSISSESKGEKDALGLVKKYPIIPEDYLAGTQESRLLQIKNARLEKADSLSEAEIVRVDFFRKITTEGLEVPILGPDPKEGLITAWVTGKGDPIRINFNAWKIDLEKTGTYPLKPISAAWEELNNGTGKLVYLREKNEDLEQLYTPKALGKVMIRNVYLAYYDEPETHDFLQPIYVFEGEAFVEGNRKADCVYYVPVLAAEGVEGATSTQ